MPRYGASLLSHHRYTLDRARALQFLIGASEEVCYGVLASPALGTSSRARLRPDVVRSIMPNTLRKPPPSMTVADFLAWPGDGTGRKFQLVDGEVRAMSPASAAHAMIQ